MRMYRHALLFVLAVASFQAAGATDEEMNRLAAARGCTFCHSMQPAKAVGDSVPPPGPAWSDVAKRYRGRPGAEDKLLAIVLQGSDPSSRHWFRTSGVVMPPNRVEISEDEARQLIRWVLR